MITKNLPYGDSSVEVSLPDRTRFPSRSLRSGLQPVADQAEAVRDALAKPLGLPRIGEPGRPVGRRGGTRRPCHDAEDAENLTSLGTTASGYDVEVHRLVADSDLTVYINAGVMLGFSGGWKSVCVGLSTWRSIRWTHTPD